MASSITFKLQGFAELKKKLEEFGPEVAKNGLRSATFAGAKVIRDATITKAPVRTGLLQANIYASRRKTQSEFQARYSVKVRPNVKVTFVSRGRLSGRYHKSEAVGPAIYGRYLEFGTSKMAKQPYLRPAFFDNQGTAIEAIRDGLERAIKRAAKK